jgi:hypothetical protein
MDESTEKRSISPRRYEGREGNPQDFSPILENLDVILRVLSGLRGEKGFCSGIMDKRSMHPWNIRN